MVARPLLWVNAAVGYWLLAVGFWLLAVAAYWTVFTLDGRTQDAPLQLTRHAYWTKTHYGHCSPLLRALSNPVGAHLVCAHSKRSQANSQQPTAALPLKYRARSLLISIILANIAFIFRYPKEGIEVIAMEI